MNADHVIISSGVMYMFKEWVTPSGVTACSPYRLVVLSRMIGRMNLVSHDHHPVNDATVMAKYWGFFVRALDETEHAYPKVGPDRDDTM